MKLKMIFGVMMLLLLSQSCKKKIYGCTLATAENYSSIATDDDGSCVTPSQNVFIETFGIDYGPGISDGTYTPTFNYEEGDLLIVEIRSLSTGTEDYWSSMPISNGSVIQWYEYNGTTGEITIHADDEATGLNYNWTSSFTEQFRVALVKKNGLKLLPGSPTISDVENLFQ